MPLKFLNESETDASSPEVDALLFTKTGELSILGGTMSDFLTVADASAVVESPEAEKAKAVFPVVEKFDDEEDDDSDKKDDDEDEEDADECLAISGEEALKVVDEEELTDLFLHYLGERFGPQLDALIAAEEAGDVKEVTSLRERAARDWWLKTLELDETKFRKGGLKRLGQKDRGTVKRMFGALIGKGVFIRKGGKAARSSQPYKKGPNYPGGSTSGKTKASRFKKTNASKLTRSRAATRLGRKAAARERMMKNRKMASKGRHKLAASVGLEESIDGFPIWGEAVPEFGVLYALSVRGAQPATEEGDRKLGESATDTPAGGERKPIDETTFMSDPQSLLDQDPTGALMAAEMLPIVESRSNARGKSE